MRFQRTSLCETLFAEIAFVGTHSGVGASVAFQIKRVIKAFATKRAQVAFDFRMTFHVSIQ